MKFPDCASQANGYGAGSTGTDTGIGGARSDPGLGHGMASSLDRSLQLQVCTDKRVDNFNPHFHQDTGTPIQSVYRYGFTVSDNPKQSSADRAACKLPSSYKIDLYMYRTC
jgi:hypothetical protein